MFKHILIVLAMHHSYYNLIMLTVEWKVYGKKIKRLTTRQNQSQYYCASWPRHAQQSRCAYTAGDVLTSIRKSLEFILL